MMPRLALALTLLATPAFGMKFERQGRELRATGQIEEGDAGRLARVIADAGTVVLDSSGGRVFEADLMAAQIRGRRLAVIVTGQCLSACFLMFIAGTDRSVSGRSRIGVHSANVDGDESASAMASTIYQARRAASLGASNTAIAKMVTTPPSQVTYLTDADLLEMGVRFVAKP